MISASTIVAEVGDLSRFRTPRELMAYVGIVPSEKDKQVKVDAVPQAVREIAWKAQSRLNQRYRALLRRGKLKNVAITAVAREFVGFIWAVAQAVGAAPAATKTTTPAAARQDGTRNGSMLIGNA